MVELLAPKVLLEYLQPMITNHQSHTSIPSHPSNPHISLKTRKAQKNFFSIPPLPCENFYGHLMSMFLNMFLMAVQRAFVSLTIPMLTTRMKLLKDHIKSKITIRPFMQIEISNNHLMFHSLVRLKKDLVT